MLGFIFDMADAILSGAFTIAVYMVYLLITFTIPVYIVGGAYTYIATKVRGEV